jgi:hypothetical protein
MVILVRTPMAPGVAHDADPHPDNAGTGFGSDATAGEVIHGVLKVGAVVVPINDLPHLPRLFGEAWIDAAGTVKVPLGKRDVSIEFLIGGGKGGKGELHGWVRCG